MKYINWRDNGSIKLGVLTDRGVLKVEEAADWAKDMAHGDCRTDRGRSDEKPHGPVVNTLMLCYTYVLCLRVKILINA